jgi:hypothetical protein
MFYANHTNQSIGHNCIDTYWCAYNMCEVNKITFYKLSLHVHMSYQSQQISPTTVFLHQVSVLHVVGIVCFPILLSGFVTKILILSATSLLILLISN